MSTKENKINASQKVFCVICSLIVCVCIGKILIPYINNRKIITLWAVSDNAQQADISNTASSSEPVSSQMESAPVIERQSDPSVNAVTEAAVKLGILSCVSRINQVATFLTANNQSGVFIFKPQLQPDKHIFSTSFELIRSDDSTLYASASFYPNQDAVYDTVEYVDADCEELAKTVFKNLKRAGIIKKNIIVLDSGSVKVFLMPAGSGTIVIKKEILR